MAEGNSHRAGKWLFILSVAFFLSPLQVKCICPFVHARLHRKRLQTPAELFTPSSPLHSGVLSRVLVSAHLSSTLGAQGYTYPKVVPMGTHGYPKVVPVVTHGYPWVVPVVTHGYPWVPVGYARGYPWVPIPMPVVTHGYPPWG